MLDREHSDPKTLKLVNEVPTPLSIIGGLCFCIIMMTFDHNNIAVGNLNYWVFLEKNGASCLSRLRFTGKEAPNFECSHLKIIWHCHFNTILTETSECWSL